MLGKIPSGGGDPDLSAVAFGEGGRAGWIPVLRVGKLREMLTAKNREGTRKRTGSLEGKGSFLEG